MPRPSSSPASAVTVATDVYSLGVILFELLTGCSPYAPNGRSLGAYEHEVLYVEPPLMSRTARPAEAGALRGDLDAIVAKALEKKPEDRYASVEAFATDIERHLAGAAHRGAAALVRLCRAESSCGAICCRSAIAAVDRHGAVREPGSRRVAMA